MRVVPYLNFAGNCEQALKFYEGVFKGKLSEFMRFGDNPFPGMPDHMANYVMHAELHFDNYAIYASDSFEPEVVSGNRYSIHIDFDSEEQIRKIHEALSQGATLDMPLEKTFWNAIYGSLTDQFGIHWSLNYQLTQDQH